MLIRPAVFDDAPAIAAVHVSSWQSTYTGLLPDSFLSSLSVASRTSIWEGVLANKKPFSTTTGMAALVLVDDSSGHLPADQVVGFCAFGSARDVSKPCQALLGSIYLLDSYQGRGDGRRLFSAACQAMVDVGFTSAVLWVLDGNDRAMHFYESAGWAPDGGHRTEFRGGFACSEHRWSCELV